jgi:hypothetical protein
VFNAFGVEGDIPHQRTIGLGMQFGRVTFHDLTLKMLDREAWMRRTEAAASYPGQLYPGQLGFRLNLQRLQ